ncbi:uncharacterized protein [Epargyreus clarus]|uniref:uncharacterized protein isoform X3 n=1 Tax=Epargyreus clarus TaxID=520877 RepID=UPI003C2E3390
MTRKEKSNHEDRYSTGPFRKLKSTKINAEGDENIYESLDNLPDAVKGSTDTIDRKARARPPIQTPSELQKSPPDVRTFPQKNASQENLTERFEQPNHSTVPRRRPNIHANRPVIHELNQVLLKKQYHLSSTSISRQPLNLEPRGQSPNQVPLSNRPPPPPHHQSSSNISRYALKPESPKKPNHEPRSYRPPPPHHLSTPSTPRQALSRKMSKVPPNPPQKPRKPEPHPPPPVSRRSHDSSDEEWTQYDILPPIENYLR